MSQSDRALHMAQLIPFRSYPKLSHMLRTGKIGILDAPRVQHIPIYKRQPQFEQKHIHGKKTWMMDFMFLKPDGGVLQQEEQKEAKTGKKTRNLITVLLAIHCNSRFCEAHVVPVKAEKYVKPLILILWHEGLIDTLITDADASFRTVTLNRLYQDGRFIKHIIYNVDALEKQNVLYAHRYLALIDRMSKTLRDMLFNCKVSDPSFTLTEQSLQSIIRIYNTTPHSTLTNIMRFPVMPVQMARYDVLQDEFIRRVMSQNVTHAKDSRTVKVGDKVYLHQPRALGLKRRNNVEDDPYVVTEIQRGTYKLSNKRNGSIKTARRGDFILM